MASSSDALLAMLHPAWQALIAGCLLVVTVIGIRRMAQRGPSRMASAILVTGGLIVAITVIGVLAVSCSPSPVGRGYDPAGSR